MKEPNEGIHSPRYQIIDKISLAVNVDYLSHSMRLRLELFLKS